MGKIWYTRAYFNKKKLDKQDQVMLQKDTSWTELLLFEFSSWMQKYFFEQLLTGKFSLDLFHQRILDDFTAHQVTIRPQQLFLKFHKISK